MDLERTQGLAFLLSLAAVPIAGCPASTEDTTSGSTGDTTGDPTTDPTDDPTMESFTTTDPTDASNSMSTTGDPTTDPSTDPSDTDPSDTDPSDTDPSDTDPSDTTTTDPTDATAETTAAEESSTDPTDEGTTGEPALCVQFGAHYAECYPKYAAYEAAVVAYCEQALMYYAAYGPECGAAAEEAFACLSTADCDQIIEDTACLDQIAAVELACGIGSESSSGGAGSE